MRTHEVRTVVIGSAVSLLYLLVEPFLDTIFLHFFLFAAGPAVFSEPPKASPRPRFSPVAAEEELLDFAAPAADVPVLLVGALTFFAASQGSDSARAALSTASSDSPMSAAEKARAAGDNTMLGSSSAVTRAPTR